MILLYPSILGFILFFQIVLQNKYDLINSFYQIKLLISKQSRSQQFNIKYLKIKISNFCNIFIIIAFQIHSNQKSLNLFKLSNQNTQPKINQKTIPAKNMADIIKVKSKKTYQWNQDNKFVYLRIPMPSHTSLKKIQIFLSDLILRVTSLEKKNTHFLDLAHEIDYKSSQNKFILTDGQIHATLKKIQQINWEKLLVQDLTLSDLKTRRRQSQARYQKHVQQNQQIKHKLRQQYDRKATQQMMRFQEEQRKILDSRKQQQKDKAIRQIFSNVNQKTGKFDQVQKAQKIKQLTVQNQQRKWREKEQLAMKMIKEEEQNQKKKVNNNKKLQHEQKIINQIQKQIGTTRPSTSASSNKPMFTQEDIDNCDKIRKEVGQTDYQEIPIRKANNIQVKFTERVFPHLAARDTYVKQPPMPKQKGNKANADGDVQSKNPLWLKDKGDKFLNDKNYTAAIQAYTQALNIDSKMLSAYANRALSHLKIFNFNSVINDCQQCLSILQGKIGGSQEDNKKSIQFIIKIKYRKAIARAWKGQLLQAKNQFNQILSNYSQNANPQTCQQIKKAIQVINLRQQSINYKHKGDQQVKLGNYQKALIYYDQSIGVDRNEYSISNKALCLNKLNNFNQSIQIINEGIQKINGFNISNSLLATSSGSSATRQDSKLNQSKRPQTILLKLYYRKAKAFEQLNKIKEAQQAVHKGLAIDSSDKDFQLLLKQINIKKNKIVIKEQKQKAAILIKEGNHNEALKIYTKCIKLIQNSDDTQEYLGLLQNQCVCYLKLGDYDSIVSTSIRILKIIKNIQSKIVEFGQKKNNNLSVQQTNKISVRTLMRRANAYLKKEQLYNAKSDLQKALQISPKDQTVQKQLQKIKQLLSV